MGGKIIVGDPSIFAIESGITRAYDRLSFRALGFFVIHIGDQCYGVYAPDATLLACSLDEIESRIARRGTHIAPFACEPDGGTIADGLYDAIYAPEEPANRFFEMSQSELSAFVYSRHLIWAPDGDEAFDDGSSVLQFDIGDRVRLIGFRCTKGYHHDPITLRDTWLMADDYYRLLQQWFDSFLDAWRAMPKISETADQNEPNKSMQQTPPKPAGVDL